MRFPEIFQPRGLSARLRLSHVLVAFTTTFIGVALLMLALQSQNVLSSADRELARISAGLWAFQTTDISRYNLPAGYTLVVDESGNVRYALGHVACAADMALVACAPELAKYDTGSYDLEGRALVVETLVTGDRLYSHRQSIDDLSLWLSLFIQAFVLSVLSLPVALLLANLTMGRVTRRLEALTTANRRFAQGDFSVRVSDPRQDDVGQLAQQFNSMADALEQNVHMLRDLARQNAELAKKAESTAVEGERGRISQDLHDSIAQTLFSLSTHAATLPDQIRRDPESSVAQADHIAALAEQAQLELRQMIVDLRPVQRHGLADALRILCDEWQIMNTIPVKCMIALHGGRIPAGIQETAYRVAQEALNNIAKHAQASTATVSLLESRHTLVLSVTDDGVGFVESAAEPGHFGLVGMRERARSVGGSVDIESDTDQGTTVRLTLPLEEMQ